MDKETSNRKISESQRELASLVSQQTDRDGISQTVIPSLSLYRASNVTEPLHSIYDPSLCVIAQGSKVVALANETYYYDFNSYLVASVRLPVTGQIMEATPQKPYLCATLSFNTNEILDVLKETDQAWSSRTRPKRGILVNKINCELLDAVVRLVRLLDTPKDISVLSPLIIREILYRVLQDDQGDLIRQFAIIGSHAQGVSKVIRLISRDYSEPLRIEALAKEVNMSASTLHSQFKQVTAMSPIQYQKLIRLQEARRLLLSETSDAATVGYTVGYESPSQFSREYARMYGLPPISDVKRIRSSLSIKTL